MREESTSGSTDGSGALAAHDVAASAALRAAAFLCYVGHGAIGLRTKASWVPLFGVAGIGEESAYRLMPLVGGCDVLAALLVLLHPCRALLAYMTAWSAWTAIVRPLAGQSPWEAVERAGNYGVPLALLLMAPPGGGWLARITYAPLTGERRRRVRNVLVATTVLLLGGHAAFGLLLEKPALADQIARTGLFASAEPGRLLAAIGSVDLALALLVLGYPASALLGGIGAWKVATESLYPLSGDSIWELVERGASYGAPVALALLLRQRRP